jgi:putative mycofactocin binding protein MftB
MPPADEASRATFSLDTAWAVDPLVSIRPEPFGALLYHFGTRRLSFLKDPRLLAVVATVQEHPSARAACLAAGVQMEEMAQFEVALARLAESHMLCSATPSQAAS